MIIDWNTTNSYFDIHHSIIMWNLFSSSDGGDYTGPLLVFYVFGR